MVRPLQLQVAADGFVIGAYPCFIDAATAAFRRRVGYPDVYLPGAFYCGVSADGHSFRPIFHGFFGFPFSYI